MKLSEIKKEIGTLVCDPKTREALETILKKLGFEDDTQEEEDKFKVGDIWLCNYGDGEYIKKIIRVDKTTVYGMNSKYGKQTHTGTLDKNYLEELLWREPVDKGGD